MPKRKNPRRGSMQFWPRKRAKNETARVRSWAEAAFNKNVKDIKFLGFAGYKVGMTHVQYAEAAKGPKRKGQDVSVPATIVECPAMKIYALRFYRHDDESNSIVVAKDVLASSLDKKLKRKIKLPKKETDSNPGELDQYCDMTAIVYTQPSLTSIGKKKPELFEMGISGEDVKAKYEFAKEFLTKPFNVDDVFKDGLLVDIHAVTTGKGFQGTVKRFGVKIRGRKSEKTKRGPGSLGGWKGHAHFMYRNAYPGQMGYHPRVDYNKKILMIGDDPEKINPKDGFINYGLVKNKYVLLMGSVPGPKKRLIRFNYGIRIGTKADEKPIELRYVSTKSNQGR